MHAGVWEVGHSNCYICIPQAGPTDLLRMLQGGWEGGGGGGGGGGGWTLAGLFSPQTS